MSEIVTCVLGEISLGPPEEARLSRGVQIVNGRITLRWIPTMEGLVPFKRVGRQTEGVEDVSRNYAEGGTSSRVLLVQIRDDVDFQGTILLLAEKAAGIINIMSDDERAKCVQIPLGIDSAKECREAAMAVSGEKRHL